MRVLSERRNGFVFTQITTTFRVAVPDDESLDT